MSKEIYLMKVAGNLMVPADDQSAEMIAKLKQGAGIKFEVKQVRNLGHHRKFYALLNHAFEAWEPVAEYKGVKIEKNMEQFRNDVIVLAGFYESTVTLKGEVRMRAKSISFANMDQEEFQALYDKVISVILSRVLTRYTKDDLENVINRIIGFT